MPSHYQHLSRTALYSDIAVRTAKRALAMIRVDDPAAAKQMLLESLEGLHAAARDVVALNAGAALCVAEVTNDLDAGVSRAVEILDSGAGLTLRSRNRTALSEAGDPSIANTIRWTGFGASFTTNTEQGAWWIA